MERGEGKTTEFSRAELTALKGKVATRGIEFADEEFRAGRIIDRVEAEA